MMFNGVTALLADQTVMQPDPNGQKIIMFGYLALLGVIMWLMVFGPQRKKAKETELMLKALRPGDKIVSTSGIIGVVLSIKERTLSIRSADTKLEILKTAVAEVTERSGETAETKS